MGTYWERCGKYCKGIRRVNPAPTHWKKNPTCACGDKKPKPKSDGTYYEHCSKACVLRRWGAFPESSYKRKPDPVLPPCDLAKSMKMIESWACVSGRCRGL